MHTDRDRFDRIFGKRDRFARPSEARLKRHTCNEASRGLCADIEPQDLAVCAAEIHTGLRGIDAPLANPALE